MSTATATASRPAHLRPSLPHCALRCFLTCTSVQARSPTRDADAPCPAGKEFIIEVIRGKGFTCVAAPSVKGNYGTSASGRRQFAALGLVFADVISPSAGDVRCETRREVFGGLDPEVDREVQECWRRAVLSMAHFIEGRRTVWGRSGERGRVWVS